MMFTDTEEGVLMLVTISHLRQVDTPVFCLSVRRRRDDF